MELDFPKEVRVGYTKFKIIQRENCPFEHNVKVVPELVERSGNETMFSFGTTDIVKKEIHIGVSEDFNETLNTLIHELFHAISFSYGMQFDDEVEEQFCLAFANGLLEIIKRNPKLKDYLISSFQKVEE